MKTMLIADDSSYMRDVIKIFVSNIGVEVVCERDYGA
jgi:hypothetical protein